MSKIKEGDRLALKKQAGGEFDFNKVIRVVCPPAKSNGLLIILECQKKGDVCRGKNYGEPCGSRVESTRFYSRVVAGYIKF